MYDSLLYHFNLVMIGDTAIINKAVADSNALPKLAEVNFLQANNIQIVPIPLTHNHEYDIITYVVVALLGIISVVWYVLPERFVTIFSLKSARRIQREGDFALKAPGKIISTIFWVNFIISVSIFVFIILRDSQSDKLLNISDYLLFEYIIITLSILFFYRFVLTFGTAFIFQTQKLRSQQVLIERNIQLITGILLLPIILLFLYVDTDFLIYLVVGAIVILQVYRLVQIAIIGKSSSVFSALHIILYLCTLEIVPILVLMRFINNNSGI
ncbi:MAG: DUF4271 domain-containing protein [Bacteroidota bacterium]